MAVKAAIKFTVRRLVESVNRAIASKHNFAVNITEFTTSSSSILVSAMTLDRYSFSNHIPINDVPFPYFTHNTIHLHQTHDSTLTESVSHTSSHSLLTKSDEVTSTVPNHQQQSPKTNSRLPCRLRPLQRPVNSFSRPSQPPVYPQSASHFPHTTRSRPLSHRLRPERRPNS